MLAEYSTDASHTQFDGYLDVNDIVILDINPEIEILSAYESAKGKICD